MIGIEASNILYKRAYVLFLFLPTAVNLRHSGPTAEPAGVPDNKAVRAVRLTSPVSLQSFFLQNQLLIKEK